jgi:hypothetical protein
VAGGRSSADVFSPSRPGGHEQQAKPTTPVPHRVASSRRANPGPVTPTISDAWPRAAPSSRRTRPGAGCRTRNVRPLEFAGSGSRTASPQVSSSGNRAAFRDRATTPAEACPPERGNLGSPDTFERIDLNASHTLPRGIERGVRRRDEHLPTLRKLCRQIPVVSRWVERIRSHDARSRDPLRGESRLRRGLPTPSNLVETGTTRRSTERYLSGPCLGTRSRTPRFNGPVTLRTHGRPMIVSRKRASNVRRRVNQTWGGTSTGAVLYSWRGSGPANPGCSLLFRRDT